MKIKTEHLKIIKDAISSVLEQYPNIAEIYEKGDFPRSDKVKDLQTRFNFDLLYGAGLNKFVCDTLYEYLNDEHIASALRSVCPTITRRY